ncbi:hypothetical protein ACF0H5_019585 [Mactra antiquata]
MGRKLVFLILVLALICKPLIECVQDCRTKVGPCNANECPVLHATTDGFWVKFKGRFSKKMFTLQSKYSVLKHDINRIM